MKLQNIFKDTLTYDNGKGQSVIYTQQDNADTVQPKDI